MEGKGRDGEGEGKRKESSAFNSGREPKVSNLSLRMPVTIRHDHMDDVRTV